MQKWALKVKKSNKMGIMELYTDIIRKLIISHKQWLLMILTIIWLTICYASVVHCFLYGWNINKNEHTHIKIFYSNKIIIIKNFAFNNKIFYWCILLHRLVWLQPFSLVYDKHFKYEQLISTTNNSCLWWLP